MVLIVASLGYLGARVANDGSGSGWHRVSSAFSRDDPLQTERDEIMSQARQFALRLNTYGPEMLDAQGTMPKYRDQVEQIITAKFRTSFEKTIPFAEATVSQTHLKREGRVYATGVAVLGTGPNADTATALVAGSFTVSYPKKKGSSDYVPQSPEPFRLEVDMVKTGGKWLVDNFAPVSQPSAGSTDGAGQ